ncbi:MAG: serine hydrolase domain-containing protein [bacterium]
MDNTAIARQIETLAGKFCSQSTPGFALLIGEKGKMLYKNGFGMADLVKSVPVTPEHSFLIGSVSKQFTTMAVMMLQERGLLAYDEPIARFFPDFPAYKDVVTIRHLMTHTAGIKEYLVDAFWQQPAAERAQVTQDSLLQLIGGWGELDFAPGTRFSYSNSGYVMLGSIVEQLSGQSFASFITERIFRPLGMKHSFVPESPAQPAGNRAFGYQVGMEGTFIPAPYDMTTIGWADGNIVSTVDDLFIWHNALNSETLVSQKTLAEAFTPYVLKNGRSTNYGFGWVNYLRRGVPEIWHSGSTAGYIARFSRFVASDTAVIMLTNYQGINRDELFGGIVDTILGSEMAPVGTMSLPAADLAVKAGIYAEGAEKICLRYDPERKKLLLNGATRRLSGEYSLSPVSEKMFRVDSPADYYVSFSAGGNPPSGLELICNGMLVNLARQAEQPQG